MNEEESITVTTPEKALDLTPKADKDVNDEYIHMIRQFALMYKQLLKHTRYIAIPFPNIISHLNANMTGSMTGRVFITIRLDQHSLP
jgi:hypothetical protein